MNKQTVFNVIVIIWLIWSSISLFGLSNKHNELQQQVLTIAQQQTEVVDNVSKLVEEAQMAQGRWKEQIEINEEIVRILQ